MSDQYSFDQFSPREFEFLCRDLIQRKISQDTDKIFLFNSFSEGADGGIDAIFENEEQRIVLQCKRYKDFTSLHSVLKYSELAKVEKLNTTRYIVATSLDLSAEQVAIIYALFKPYIKDTSDIVHKAMINNLLALNRDIELNYPRLYLNNTTALRHLLEANVYNQTNEKLKQFYKISQFYVANGSFQQNLDKLRDKNFLIISGEPGVGKSTLAGMISLYYYQKEGYEFIFLRKSVAEGEGGVWDDQKKQLFLFDDFLGSITFEGFSRNEDRQLLDFVNKIVNSSNKLLIITTREYVFKQAVAKYPELKKRLFNKSIIRQREFTTSFKIDILYNYLYYSKIELKHIKPLLYERHYKAIVYHRNFTPRLIDDYIEHYYNKSENDYGLYFGLKKYLDDPYVYWEEVFLRLNDNAQVLLLILAITEEPAIEEFLFQTFVRVGKHRKIFKKGFEKDSFEHALSELSESFISIMHNPEVEKGKRSLSNRDYSLIFNSFRTSRYIEFQNPSIKDFTVNYLRKREDLISYLLKGAVLFNQLFFVFTTLSDDNDIDDFDSSYPYAVGKIILSHSLQELIAYKIFQEFDTLPIAKIRKIDWEGDISSFHIDEERFHNRMEKLWLLCLYFPIDQHEEVRNFVTQRYLQILEEDEKSQSEPFLEDYSEFYVLSLEERIAQIDVILKLCSFMQFDSVQTVSKYYKNIRFSKEFISLHYLEKPFFDAYQQVITKNLKQIRHEIKDMIYDDIDHYLCKGTYGAGEALDTLLYEDLDQLRDIYKFKLSKKMMLDINEMSGRKLFHFDAVKVSDVTFNDHQDEILSTPPPIDDKLKIQRSKLALERLIPKWEEPLDQDASFEYIRLTITNNSIAQLLLKRIVDDNRLEDFLGDTHKIDLLIIYLETFEEQSKNSYSLYEDILTATKLTETQLTELQQIAFILYKNGLFTFRKDSFENALHKNNNSLTVEIESYSSVVMQQDIWYEFVNRKFHVFLAARYIINLQPEARKLIYQGFSKVHDEIHYENIDFLWDFCYEADKRLFCDSFIIPVIEHELEKFDNKENEGMSTAFLKEFDVSYDFEYSKEEDYFECHSASGGDALPEDIFEAFDWNVTYPFWDIENCFNISSMANAAQKRNLKKYFPVKDGKYSVNVTQHLASKEFCNFLNDIGVVKIIAEYVDALRMLLTSNNSPLL